MDEAKPFDIPKREVWEAFKKVKANQGAAGVDGQSIVDFEDDLSNNLYELWNRLSSGSYFPSPVRRVDIPKADGGMRPLGIPTVADRVAQEVARRYLEPRLEPVFHTDSYGYRPGKSAIDAVRQARQRCWRYDWVLDLDVKAYFDSIDWELMLRAVRRHTNQPWVLLYIERWLKAPVQLEDGSVVPRRSGTPQGGVVSPILANLFLHYTFDMWMAKTFPHIPFERYADDAICHCKSAAEALALWSALADRFAACNLVLHPEKTKIVYCKDANRRGDFPARRSGLQLLQVFEILPQAVTGEPFSTADSLLSRENTGNFRDSGPYWLLRQNLKNLQKLQSQPPEDGMQQPHASKGGARPD